MLWKIKENDMKKIFFYFMLSCLCLKAATINEDELRVFANTQVDDTLNNIKNDIKAYLKIKGFDRLPEGHSSLFLAPIPGEKGALDETVTLLRFSPMQNAAIAAAQLRLVRGFLSNEVFSEYEGIIREKDSSIESLERRIVLLRNNLQQVSSESDDLLRLIQALTATLQELSTKTQQQLEQTQQQAANTITQMTQNTRDVQAAIDAAAGI